MEEFIAKEELLEYIQDILYENRKLMFGSQYDTDCLEAQNGILKLLAWDFGLCDFEDMKD